MTAENAKKGTNAWSFPAKEGASDSELAGYLNHDSITSGTRLTLYVTSTFASFTATAYRLGWYGGTGGRQVWASATLPGKVQPKPLIKPGHMVDASNWTPTTTIDTTGWPEGVYLIKLAGGGKYKWVPLTIRSTSAAGKLLLVNATPTYQAYNAYGGYSLYRGPGGFVDRASSVSFNRPYDRTGGRLVTAGERQITELAERLGLPVAYATQVDVNNDPALLQGARGVVSEGHDEYWTVAMRDAWEKARDRGTNLAFFGANSSYWRIRITDGGRVVTSFKSSTADPVKGQADTTAQWRQNPHARPENSMTGLLYECFPARGPMVITDPTSWLLAGTGAKAGLRYNGLVGVEIDRAYPIAGTPSTLEVVAHTPVACGQIGQTYSDLAYYTAASGAGVVDTGSMSFSVGLLGPNPNYDIDTNSSRFSTQVATTLLRAMAAGPMGKAHPAHPNLASLHASASTSTGSGGAIGSVQSGTPQTGSQ